jgi:hypothetical protein
MEGTEGLTNMERFYAQRANDALEAFKAGRFAECDSIYTDLLCLPRFPSKSLSCLFAANQI